MLMQIKKLYILLMLAALTVSNFASADTAASKMLKESENTPGFQPKEGMVPDTATAISIAVAVWNPIYGEKEIALEKPYNATLKSGLWTVTGSVPGGWVGGVATAVISKKDGRIIKVYHTK